MPPALILFHYPMSPFSQKVRAMLGYAQIPWQSVTVREMPPRPLLEQLAGGYRRIPVAQIGADLFCDTRAIATEIARLSGRRALALERCGAAAQRQALAADRELLLACLVCANTLAMGRKLLKSMPLLDIPRFLWDRVNIGRRASVDTAALLRNPRRLLLAQLARLEAQLQGRDFLAGAAPNHADFASYHGLWFVRDLGESAIAADFPRVNAWLDRINAFGDGLRSEIDGAEASRVAAASTPRRIAVKHRADPRIGRAVAIRPADYAQDASHGLLAGVTPTQWILARDAPRLGRLQVHFPRQGFELRDEADQG